MAERTPNVVALTAVALVLTWTVTARSEPSGEPAETEDEDEGVDRFSLAREFGQLLQGGEDPADG